MMRPEWMNFGFTFDEFTFPRGRTYEDAPNMGYPMYDYSDVDDEQRAHAPDGVSVLLDAGFAAGYEVIPISEAELVSMPENEWNLLQRLISEPVSYPNTQISCSNVAAGNVVLTILHHVPCITNLEK